MDEFNIVLTFGSMLIYTEFPAIPESDESLTGVDTTVVTEELLTSTSLCRFSNFKRDIYSAYICNYTPF